MTTLSITIPTFNRPDGLRTALRSVTSVPVSLATTVEIVVSDNSTDSRSEAEAKAILKDWPGPSQYVHHVPGLGMVGNHNACLSLATGRWQLVLHDDDYLLDGGVEQLLAGIAESEPHERVLVFGVRVCDERGRRLRVQRFRRRRYRGPAEALRKLLTGSSFVRIPAICVRTDAYDEAGTFEDGLHGVDDYEMWLRLFARYGVTTVPRMISAYVIHSSADTEGMFDRDGIAGLFELFRRAEATGLLSSDELHRRQRAFVHQFILAGALRRFRRREWHDARLIMRLFDLPEVAQLGRSTRWLPVRAVWTAVIWVFARNAGGEADRNDDRL
jgi:glycosyltransferase involved in cell wall biosynthesis